jgi:hypothetical protein
MPKKGSRAENKEDVEQQVEPQAKKRVKKEKSAENNPDQDKGTKMALGGEVPRDEHKRMMDKLGHLSRGGHTAPLQRYHSLKSVEDKIQFFKSFKAKGNFAFTMVESKSYHNVTETDTFEGWMNKYQVADQEKVPVDSDFLKDILAGLTSKRHDNEALADKGELLYHYSARDRTTKRQNYMETTTGTQDMALSSSVGQALMTGSAIMGSAPLRALEDKAKEEENPNKEDFEKAFKELQKITNSLVQIHKESVGFLGRLLQGETTKPHYATMKTSLEHGLKPFTEQKDKAITKISTLKELEENQITEEIVKNLKDFVQESKDHTDAFKAAIYTEVKKMLG